MTNIQLPSSSSYLTSIRRLFLVFIVAVTPSLVSYLLVTINGYHTTDFLPRYSDEVSYWNQINTFREVGMDGGYFTIYELAPAAEFTHFYTYGPWYPALYGTLARIIGWNATTLLTINTLLIGLALALFCYGAQLKERQLLITLLFLATMWGLLSFFFTGMQEGFQQAIAIVLASVFVVVFRHGEKASIRLKLIGLAVITLASIMRLSWAIFYVPFLFLVNPKTMRRRLISLGIAFVLTVAVMQFSNFTGAPGNNTIFTMLSNFKVSVGIGIQSLIEYFLYNLGRLFLYPKPATDVLQTYQVFGMIIASVAFIIQFYLHHNQRFDLLSEAKFHLYNVGITLVAVLALYIVSTGGDYRVFASHLMISFLLMIALKRYRLVLVFIALNVLCIPFFLHDFQQIALPNYEADHTVYTDFKTTAQTFMPYDPDVKNAWCNTLLFSVRVYDGKSLAALPAGIGLSFFHVADNPMLTFKSRYLLLYDDDYHIIVARDNAPKLAYLADTRIGKLYLNQDVDCSVDS